MKHRGLDVGNTGSMVVGAVKKPRGARKPKTSAPKDGK